MSNHDRPSYQRPTISRSSPSVTPTRRTPGNVPLVRGLSPVRSPYCGRTQEIESPRSHDNPLFRSQTSDVGERRSSVRPVGDTGFAKATNSSKENSEIEEPWKVHVEKVQFGSRQGCTTPGKTSRLAPMQFTTPPKPLVKRKILTESNRDVSKPLSCSTPRRREEKLRIPMENVTSTVAEDGFRSDVQIKSSDPSIKESCEQQPAMASIEELQQRIQKFLKTEIPVLPVRNENDSVGGFSGGFGEENTVLTAENGVAYHQPFSPYSQPPELPRTRTRSPSPGAREVVEEESITQIYDRSPVPMMEKSMTPASYDSKTNYLSPRPQFLRYRPQKRLEMLRRSAEFLNLNLDSLPTDSSADSGENELEADSPTSSVKLESEGEQLIFSSKEESEADSVVESAGVELVTCANDLTESRCLAADSLTPPSDEARDDTGECIWDSCQVKEELRVEHAGVHTPPSHDAGGEIGECHSEECKVELREVQTPGNEKNSPDISGSSTLTSEIGEIIELVHDASEVDSVPPERDLLQESKEESNAEEIELPEVEEITSLHVRILSSFACAFIVAAFILLVLLSSGSPGLLPKSFHQNEIAAFWRTSEYAAPVRMFLESVECLWKETPGLYGYPVNQLYMETLGTNLQDARKAIAGLDSEYAVNFINELYSTSAAYVAPFSAYVTQTYLDVRKWLSEAADSYISRAPDVEEWAWIPEYDFVMAKDVFDWTEAYETILAKVESSEVKSIFQSHVESNGAKSVHEYIEEISLEDDLDATSIAPESEAVSVDTQLEHGASVLLVPVIEFQNNQFTLSPDNERDSGEVEEQTLLESENQDEFFGSSSLAVGGAMDDTVVSSPAETPSVIPPTVVPSEGGSLATCREEFGDVDSSRVDESDDVAAASWNSQRSEVQSINPVENTVDPADSVKDLPQQRSQESPSTETENLNLLPIEDAMRPEGSSESILSSTMVADNEPELSSVTLQPGSSYPLYPAVLTASVASLLVASVLAAMLLKPARRSISRILRLTKDDTWEKKSMKAARMTKGKLPREPQRSFKTSTNSQILDSASNSLPEDSALHATLTSDYAEHLSTSIFSSEKQYSQPAIDKSAFLSPERSSKPLTDNSSFLNPEVEVLEDSSLGRFTALVPVVHNEGTEKEEVKLTPVRRSSRIRSRLQSPCITTLSHFSYSP
ncbi:hypothetical protein R1flu_002637 [Riccia fluitans]|uniref:Transmembrane protein n=1 Tax=Riccia fluitans TaxID=41844 RepID=A0ABD1Y9M7_9MARC